MQNKTPIQWQNKMNNAKGNAFEKSILTACQIYRNQKRAEIDKTPEPFRVMEKHNNGLFTGRFTSHAQPDFQGTICGGQSICFEAKYTNTERMNWNVLTNNQMKALEYHKKMGAVTGVCIGIKDNFYFIPWIVWRDMKNEFGRLYITQKDIAPFRVRYRGAVMFLDYIT